MKGSYSTELAGVYEPQLNAQGPSRTCNESKGEEDEELAGGSSNPHPGQEDINPTLRVGHLWRDKWTAATGPLSLQGYLAHKKQRPPRTLQ